MRENGEFGSQAMAGAVLAGCGFALSRDLRYCTHCDSSMAVGSGKAGDQKRGKWSKWLRARAENFSKKVVTRRSGTCATALISPKLVHPYRKESTLGFRAVT